MSDSHVELTYLRKTMCDLRDSIKGNTEVMSDYNNAINMSNLLKMIELGMISKEDVKESSLYKSYVDNLVSKTKKKSLF